MRVLETVDGLTAALADARRRGRRVGLVPTMGALHGGHRSLIARAVAECDHVAVTIFVNPLQFGDPGDLARYPRALDGDLAVCEAAGVSSVFAPTVAAMYPLWPAPPATTVSVTGVSARWEGASRPGHFDGVATVVAKLFSMAGACTAYFGEKDFQQLVIVRRLAADLSMPVTVVGCPTVRDVDGLALSSRNARLDPAARAAAPVLFRALGRGARTVEEGAASPEAVAAAMAAEVAAEPLATLDYAAVVDAATLAVPPTLAAPAALRLLVAATVGGVRLIDNCPAVVPAAPAVPPSPEALAVAGGREVGHNLATGPPPHGGGGRPEAGPHGGDAAPGTHDHGERSNDAADAAR